MILILHSSERSDLPVTNRTTALVDELKRRGFDVSVVTHSPELFQTIRSVNVIEADLRRRFAIFTANRLQRVFKETEITHIVADTPAATLHAVNFAKIHGHNNQSRISFVTNLSPDNITSSTLRRLDDHNIKICVADNILSRTYSERMRQSIAVTYAPYHALTQECETNHTSSNQLLCISPIITRNTDLRTVAEVHAALPHTRLLIAGMGEGRYVMPIIRLSRQLESESRMEWCGEGLTQDNVRQSSVVIIPDTAGNSQTEAIIYFASLGKPCIVTDNCISGIENIIRYTPDRPATLVKALDDAKSQSAYPSSESDTRTLANAILEQ